MTVCQKWYTQNSKLDTTHVNYFHESNSEAVKCLFEANIGNDFRDIKVRVGKGNDFRDINVRVGKMKVL